MNIRPTTKLFAVLSCIYKNGDLSADEVVLAMRKSQFKDTPSRIKIILNDAVAHFYLYKRRERYFLSEEAEAYVADVQDIKDRKPKENLVASPYKNIWTPPISGYTANLFRNKRNYQG